VFKISEKFILCTIISYNNNIKYLPLSILIEMQSTTHNIHTKFSEQSNIIGDK